MLPNKTLFWNRRRREDRHEDDSDNNREEPVHECFGSACAPPVRGGCGLLEGGLEIELSRLNGSRGRRSQNARRFIRPDASPSIARAIAVGPEQTHLGIGFTEAERLGRLLDGKPFHIPQQKDPPVLPVQPRNASSSRR